MLAAFNSDVMEDFVESWRREVRTKCIVSCVSHSIN